MNTCSGLYQYFANPVNIDDKENDKTMLKDNIREQLACNQIIAADKSGCVIDVWELTKILDTTVMLSGKQKWFLFVPAFSCLVSDPAVAFYEHACWPLACV